MNRRNFIKSALGTGLVTAGSCVFRSPFLSSAHATPLGLPTLVVIFQRGGCDGLNTVIPYADNNYYNLRPTIGIPGPNSAETFKAIDLDGFFGLHPSMSSLIPFFDNNNMAILPTVHYPSATRSHFSSQHVIESGYTLDNPGMDTLDGWLNRHLQLAPNSALPLQGVGFGSNLAQSLRGTIPVQSFSSISSFNLGLDNTNAQVLIDNVLPVYQEAASPQTAYRELVHRFGNTLFGNLDAVSHIDPESYQEENGAMYPNGNYGRQLKEAAQLIKDPNIGLEVVTIDTGGYDTHSAQGGAEPEGRLSRRLGDFSQGIAALMTDLGSKMDDVIILTQTEFGRTSKENGSRGTDHGHAASWFMFGNKVQGGIHLNGQWPGLASEELYQGRYLADTIDYRNIIGDILINHLGHSPASLASLLPGHNYQTLNLINS